jgi:hypothetical protein
MGRRKIRQSRVRECPQKEQRVLEAWTSYKKFCLLSVFPINNMRSNPIPDKSVPQLGVTQLGL